MGARSAPTSAAAQSRVSSNRRPEEQNKAEIYAVELEPFLFISLDTLVFKRPFFHVLLCTPKGASSLICTQAEGSISH